MVSALLGIALAAPVECDSLEATRILAEARVEEAGASKTHPWLVPGLALAASRTDPELRTLLGEMCAEGGELSVRPTADWETTEWAAHSVLLTRSETRGCTLFERAVTITVGVKPGAAARYALQNTLPVTRTPVGDCETDARWHEETVLDGEDGPVRLVLATVRDGDDLVQSAVLVRRATPEGWREQVLAEPAPERLLGGFAGPEFHLRETAGEWLVVQTHDRTGTPEACEPVPGQIAWTWSGAGWIRHDSDAARALLAEHAVWRLAGEPGWLLILAQDTEDDREVLESRARRLNRRNPTRLLFLNSADFPGLNAGFIVVTPAPFADRATAEAARLTWGRRSSTYVKRAWPQPDPCQ